MLNIPIRRLIDIARCLFSDSYSLYLSHNRRKILSLIRQPQLISVAYPMEMLSFTNGMKSYFIKKFQYC